MKCSKVCNLLSERLDGRLSFEEERQLDEHLDLCPSCMKEFRALETTVNLVRGLPELTPSETFVQDVLRRSRVEKHARAEKPSFGERIRGLFRLPTWEIALRPAAAVLALGLVVGIGGSMLAFRSVRMVPVADQAPTGAQTQLAATSSEAVDEMPPPSAREFEELVQEMLQRVEAEKRETEGTDESQGLDWGSFDDLNSHGRQVGAGSPRQQEPADGERVTVVF